MTTLENCSIKFYTKGAGKKTDTRISVAVKDERETVAAFISDKFGDFDAHTENGPFNMAIVNASAKGDLRMGSIAIGFEPKESDPWQFNFFVFMSFSDGTRLTGGKVGLELNGKNREETCRLNEITR